MILRTAAAVIAREGYHQASIRHISRATGVSLSGLYYYFDSKEELLFLIQDHCFRTVLDNAESLVAEVSDPERRLRLLIESHLRFFAANMEEMKVLSHEADTLNGEYRDRVNEVKRRYTAIFERTVEATRPKDSAIDARVATFALFGMMNWIYNWYRPEVDVEADALADQIALLFLGGHLGRGDAVASLTSGDSRPAPNIWA